MTLNFLRGEKYWRVDFTDDDGRIRRSFTMMPEQILTALIDLGVIVNSTDEKEMAKAFRLAQKGKRYTPPSK